MADCSHLKKLFSFAACATCGVPFTSNHRSARFCSRGCYDAEKRCTPEKTIALFLSHVMPEPNSGCLLWLGALQSNGYGKFSMYGRHASAHRAAWTLLVGAPGEKWVLHRCDTPLCVNVDHLFLGDCRENTDDKTGKRRHRYGERVSGIKAKLTVEQAAEIVALSKAGQRAREIAGRYSVSAATVAAIIRGDRWRVALEEKAKADQTAELAGVGGFTSW